MADETLPKRAAIYARVSSDQQTTNNQLRVLHQVAKLAGWEVVKEYVDEGISGSKGRAERPAFDELHRAAVAREFDVVMAVAIDRLGRSLKDLLQFMEEMAALRIDLYLHRERLDTTTPMGRMIFQVTGAFAEFERSVIKERIHAGLERAKKHGTRSGKPIGRPRVTTKVERDVRRLRAQGLGKRKIAGDLGIGVSTVMRVTRRT